MSFFQNRLAFHTEVVNVYYCNICNVGRLSRFVLREGLVPYPSATASP